VSALYLYKTSASGGACREPQCGNAGRYQLFLAGHRCDSNFGPEVVCKKHAREIARLFADLAPPEETIVDALEAIRGTAAERCDAIELLRDIGYGPDAIARAVKGVAERLPVEQLLEVLAGELEAVAA
jgi:hypothetical protein